MAARSVIKNFNLFVDGKGMAGQIDEYNPPKQTLKTEEYRAGGMDAPLELTMGMEKLEADATLIAYDADVLSLYGVVEGQQVSFTARGHMESFDGTTAGIIHNLRGKIKELDRGTWKAGEKPALKFSMALSYFKETINGVIIAEIDVENMVYSVGGVDLLAAARSNLGI
jgi:P2 family phage contractile tail tube protein